MAWFYYLLEANCYLAISFGIYFLLLRKETFYRLNRWFLMGTTILAFLLPLFAIDWQTIAPLKGTASFKANFATSVQVANAINIAPNTISVDEQGWKTEILLWIYLIISISFLLKTAYGVFNIIKLYRYSSKYRVGHIVHVLLPTERKIFSFFNWLFYHRDFAEEKAIIAHEMAHVEEKHSIDLLFYEIIIAFNWFNPLVYSLFNEVKINHEYYADQKAIKKANSKYEYAKLLIDYVSEPVYRLSHAISNAKQLEKRIEHLTYKKSAKAAAFKFLVTVPLLIGFLVLSAFVIPKDYAVVVYHIAHEVTEKKILSYPSKRRLDKQAQIIDTIKTDLPILAPLVDKSKKKIIAQENVPSELVKGEIRRSDGKRINALEVMFDWTKNPTNAEIRQVKHSVFAGSEAQLFRGAIADTLYVDYGQYQINGNEIELMTAQLLIGKMEPSVSNKKLVIIDAKKKKIIKVLPQVAIKTKGIIHEVKVIQPPDGTAQKTDLISYNMRVQYARINGINVITEKEDQSAPYQPSILW